MDNVYDDINKIYDDCIFYNNEFINYDDDFSFWKYWIDYIKPEKVLEIGIGNGRLINLLSSSVKQYDAIEISKNIINEFYKNYSISNGSIFNQDMKNINLKCKYDLIVIPFNTFSYLYTLSDLELFFNGLKSISNEKTIIIIDIINPSVNDISDQDDFMLCRKLEINKNEYELYEKHAYDSKKQIITYIKKYINKNETKIFRLPVRIFYPQEIINLVSLFGFNVKTVFGDYNNEDFNNNSRKQILFLKMR